MGLAPEVSLVVKHTFLEWIRTDVPKRRRSRSLTDSDLVTGGGLPVARDVPTVDLSAALTAEKRLAEAVPSPALRPSDASPVGCPTPLLEGFPMTPFLECALDLGLAAHADPTATADLKDALGLPPSAAEVLAGMSPDAYYAQGIFFDDINYPCVWAYLPCDDGYGDCEAWAAWQQHMAAMAAQQCDGSDDGRTSETVATEGAGAEAPGAAAEETRTTVMLREIPTEVSRDILVQVLDTLGLHAAYDMVYVPVDFSSGNGLGYAFVNMVSPHDVPTIWAALDGFSQWGLEGVDGACSVRWAEPNQGLVAHIERYRNSPVMHAEVPDDWKPALFSQGIRTAFPPPTKKLKSPKVRSKKAAASD